MAVTPVVASGFVPQLSGMIYASLAQGATVAQAGAIWAASQAAAAVTLGAASGAVGGAIMSGSVEGALKGGLIGGLTAGAFFGVGEIAPSGLGNIAGHAAVGCVSSAAQGGSCGSGAAAGAAGSAWSNYGVKFESLVANVVAHAVVGGTTSVLGGGKFANGASTAAFGYLFNEFLHFNGSRLRLLSDDGVELRSWAAVSGVPGTTYLDQYSRNYGPIPEGQYWVDPKDTNYDRWWKLGWGSNDAWGEVRTVIRPDSITNLGGRTPNAMYMHGGALPGSIGCIDLTKYNNDFHAWLKSWGKPIDLRVSYPRPTPSPPPY